MLAPQGQYYNFSGCGNTFNCNHPVVQVLRPVSAAPSLPIVAKQLCSGTKIQVLPC